MDSRLSIDSVPESRSAGSLCIEQTCERSSGSSTSVDSAAEASLLSVRLVEGESSEGDIRVEEIQPSADRKDANGDATGSDTAVEVEHVEGSFSWRRFMIFIGPGLLMSIAFMDPGNIEADVQAGAHAGYTLLWFYALSSVFGFTFQCLAARLGVASGKDLSQHCGKEYPPVARILLWLLLEVAIIGADIQETVGGAIGIYILSGSTIPLWAGCLLGSASAFSVLLLEQMGARHLEAVFGCLIGIQAVSLGVNYVQAGVPQDQVMLGLVIPRLPAYAISTAVGALGAIVMPHNVYFHSSLVTVSRKYSREKDAYKSEVLNYVRLESAIVILIAFVVNLFVVAVFAQGFFGKDFENVGLLSGGDYLGETFGKQYKYMWAIGLIASAQSATISLTYAGQFVMAGFLSFKVKGWTRMVGTRILALVPAVAVAILFETSNGFDTLNQLLNILQSLMLPFALIPVIHMTSNKRIMGNFTSSKPLVVFTGLVTLAALVINGYLLVQFLQNDLPQTATCYILFSILIAAYYIYSFYLALGPGRFRKAILLGRDHGLAAAKWCNKSKLVDPQSMMEMHF